MWTMLSAPDAMLERLEQATAALVAAEQRNPYGDDIDALIDDATAARIALRRSRIDRSWSAAEDDLSQLAQFAAVLSEAGFAAERDMPWWLVMRLATGTLMERYSLDKNRAVALLARVAERNEIPIELLADRVLHSGRPGPA
jgi:hypothetical protein